MKKGLGKGLEALFEQNTPDSVKQQGQQHVLRISQIEPDKQQPRKDFDEKALDQLTESIKTHGVITPIVVTKLKDDRYKIIAGERRWRAARRAGLTDMPVVIKEYSDEQSAQISLVENLQRQDLNPLEEANGYKKLMDQYGYTQEQVANLVSKSRSAVANALRLLALPEGVLDFIKTAELSAGHARALLALDDKGLVLMIADKIIADELSVRQTEQLVKKLNEKKPDKKELDSETRLAIEQLENRAAAGTGNKVKIKHSLKNRGRVEIFYNSIDELDKIIDILSDNGGQI